MQQNEIKEIHEQAWLGGKGDPLGIVQEAKILLCWQMLYTQTRIRAGKWDNILWDLEIQTDHQIPTREPDLVLISKKKELVILWVLTFQ